MKVYYQFSLHHLYIYLWKVGRMLASRYNRLTWDGCMRRLGEMYFLSLGVKGLNPTCSSQFSFVDWVHEWATRICCTFKETISATAAASNRICVQINIRRAIDHHKSVRIRDSNAGACIGWWFRFHTVRFWLFLGLDNIFNWWVLCISPTKKSVYIFYRKVTLEEKM